MLLVMWLVRGIAAFLCTKIVYFYVVHFYVWSLTEVASFFCCPVYYTALPQQKNPTDIAPPPPTMQCILQSYTVTGQLYVNCIAGRDTRELCQLGPFVMVHSIIAVTKPGGRYLAAVNNPIFLKVRYAKYMYHIAE